MIFDYENLMSEDQTVAMAAGTTPSTNVIDLAKAGVGRGHPVKLFVQMTQTLACTTPGSTLTVVLQTDDNASFISPTCLFTTDALVSTVAVAGYKPIDVFLPANVERYIRMSYIIATQTSTAGKVTAGIVPDQQSNDDPVALGLTS